MFPVTSIEVLRESVIKELEKKKESLMLREATSPGKKAIQQEKKETVKKIRAYFKKKGIKASFRISGGLAMFVYATVKEGEFPKEMRIKALQAVYGRSFKISDSAQAGNIQDYQMVMNTDQWQKFLDTSR